MHAELYQRKSKIIIGLILLVVLGGMLRIYDLDKSTITHPEIYVPGIELPADISAPDPRFTFSRILTTVIACESHPPGYYWFMLVWTKLFGTSIIALRLPSVLFGIVCIVLIFIIGLLEKNELTGLFAAGMLAFSGYHIFWSQEARMYSMGCFLGLLATVLLLFIIQGSPRKRMLKFMYSLVALAGLATTYYFWPIYITHILWVFLWNILNNKKTTLGLFRIQILILILGCPFLAIAVFQSRRPSFVELEILRKLSQFLQFGFLLEPDPFIFPPKSISIFIRILLITATLILFGYGLRSKKDYKENNSIPSGPFSVVILLSGILMCCVILIFANFAHDKDSSRTELIIVTSAFPLLLALLDFLVHQYWGKIEKFYISKSNRLVFLKGLKFSISSFLAIIPLMMIIVISFFVSLFTSRGSLLYVPYLIIVLSMGLVSLISHNHFWIVLLVFLAVIHIASVIHYSNRLHSPIDYKSFSELWATNIEDTDLIFVQRHWVTT
ncbi:MAG: glycosyltransferase family 39 protein, partial [Candidatus Hodarchaeota archaeon]